MDAITEIQKEILKAEDLYGNFNSTHEAYAVLKEEVDELWDIVKKNTERTYGLPEWKVKALVPELIQIAAIAIRTANELQTNKIKFI
jgi:RNAse (barnase) inhibitor barstar